MFHKWDARLIWVKKFYERHHDLVNPYNVAVCIIISEVFATGKNIADFQNPGHTFLMTFSFSPWFRLIGTVGLPSNANFPWTLDYTLSFMVHVCSSEHFDLSFVYRCMRLLYGLGTLTTDFFLHDRLIDTSV